MADVERGFRSNNQKVLALLTVFASPRKASPLDQPWLTIPRQVYISEQATQRKRPMSQGEKNRWFVAKSRMQVRTRKSGDARCQSFTI